MTLFEVMTVLTVSLAIAIPTFMDKVMRPKYEERFSEFREARRDVFLDEFENAFNQLKKTKEEMTPEIIETMESLFNEWGQVKSDENKLSTLLRYRKLFYFGWFVSGVLCLFSIEYSETLIPQTRIPLGNVAIFVFIVIFCLSLWYGYELFELDEKLSKFKTKTTGETFGKAESIGIIMESYRQAESKVENTLKKFGIPFNKNIAMRTNGGVIIPDYVISSKKTPKYLIEVKTRIRSRDIYSLSLRYRAIKTDRPLKKILISNFRSEEELKYAKAYWDFVIDFQNLDELEKIIKL